MIFVSHSHGRQTPGVFGQRIEGDAVSFNRQRGRMTEVIHRSIVVISQRFLVIGAPTRSLARQGSSKRKAYRGNIESHIDPAAAIESALRIRIVEVVYDSRHHHALEFIQLVLEY